MTHHLSMYVEIKILKLKKKHLFVFYFVYKVLTDNIEFIFACFIIDVLPINLSVLRILKMNLYLVRILYRKFLVLYRLLMSLEFFPAYIQFI